MTINESPIEWLPQWLRHTLSGADNGARIYLVGGAVRDKIIGVETKDFDFVVDGEARFVARNLANILKGSYYDLDTQRGTGRSIIQRESGDKYVLDFASLRGATIRDDLEGRDFTLNALAIDLENPTEIIDPLAGLQDLKDRILRTCSPEAIMDDPIRSLRAARLAVQLETKIDSQSLDQIRTIKHRLRETSPERVRDEIFRILSLAKPATALRLLDHFNLLDVVFPELKRLRGLNRPTRNSYDLLEQTLATVEHLSIFIAFVDNDQSRQNAADLVYAEFSSRLGRFQTSLREYLGDELSHGRSVRELLLLGALFHNVERTDQQGISQSNSKNKESALIAAKRIVERAHALRLSKSETQWLRHTAQNRDYPSQVPLPEFTDARNVYHALSTLDHALPAITLIFLAELLAENEPPLDQDAWVARIGIAHALFDGFWNAAIDDKTHPPLIRGDELQRTFGIQPGPELGVILEKLQEAQYVGEIKSKQEAIVFAQKIRDQIYTGVN